MNARPPLSGVAEARAPRAPRAPAVVPGDLVESPDYAFAFREMPSEAPAPARRLLVALHGADADEWQFAGVLGAGRPGDVVVLPRGPRTLPGGRTGWFREAVGDGEAHVQPQDFDDSLARLVAFVGQVQGRHAVAPADTVLVGFSQGGALALSAAVTSPETCGAVAVIGGRLPRRVEPQVEMPPALSNLRVLLVHAPDDDVLPPTHAEAAAAFLTAQEMAPTMRLAGRGHDLTTAAVAELRAWLAALPAGGH